MNDDNQFPALMERCVTFKRTEDGEGINIIIQIGYPKWTIPNLETSCPVAFVGGIGRVTDIRGVDPINAMQNAIEFIDKYLTDRKGDEKFYWESGEEYEGAYMNDEERRQRIHTLLKKFTWNDDPVNMATVTAEVTLLHYAASAGDMEAVKLLVELDEDVNAIGNMGNTPLHRAAQQGHFEIYDYLVAHGASEDVVNEAGDTPKQVRDMFTDKE